MLCPIFRLHLLHCNFRSSDFTQTAAEKEEHAKAAVCL